MASNKITSVTDPTSAQDAATKNYVDTHTASTAPLVRVATANTVATTGDDMIVCNVATTNMTVTLYTAASGSRKVLHVKNKSQTGTCSVAATSTSEAIFAATGNETQVIVSPGDDLGFMPDGSAIWYLF